MSNVNLQEFLSALTKNSNGTYSSNKLGYVVVPKCAVENGRLKIEFDTIKGSFNCSSIGLTILAGCPKYVGGGLLNKKKEF